MRRFSSCPFLYTYFGVPTVLAVSEISERCLASYHLYIFPRTTGSSRPKAGSPSSLNTIDSSISLSRFIYTEAGNIERLIRNRGLKGHRTRMVSLV